MNTHFLTRKRVAALLALGAANALAFAPAPLPNFLLPFVQLACLVGLAYVGFQAPSRGTAAASGFLFGLTTFGVGLYWIFISLHYYGGLASPLAVLAVIVLAAGLALFPAAALALSHALGAGPRASGYQGQWLAAAVWASSWTLLEWLRGTLFTGFPWLNIGYAHVEGMLVGWAPVFGVYGLAWLAAFASAGVALLMHARRAGHNEAQAATAVAGAIVLALAGIALRHVAWASSYGEPFIVRLAQGNIPQSEKFDPQLMKQGMDTYMRLAALPPKEEGAGPQLIVLPETVMTLFQNRYPPEVWAQWRDIAQKQEATILMGVPLHDATTGQDRYTNSAIAISGDTPIDSLVAGAVSHRYDKHHLVPFGEFVPPGFRWFVDALQIPLGDFDRGPTRQDPFSLLDQGIAPNICYEDVFGEEIIRAVRAGRDGAPGASLLVNMSNLGWFGRSWALRQHLQISRMRALETARPMLRATNTGVTAAIDPLGNVRAALPEHSLGVLDVEIQGTTGLTPYVRWGNLPVTVVSVLLLLAGVIMLRRRSAD